MKQISLYAATKSALFSQIMATCECIILSGAVCPKPFSLTLTPHTVNRNTDYEVNTSVGTLHSQDEPVKASVALKKKIWIP